MSLDPKSRILLIHCLGTDERRPDGGEAPDGGGLRGAAAHSAHEGDPGNPARRLQEPAHGPTGENYRFKFLLVGEMSLR